MEINLIFAWYDIWIGFFWDRAKRKLYILPIPCFGVVLTFNNKSGNYYKVNNG